MAEPAILSDVAPLASCLRVLILDSKRRQAMVTASRERASSIFRQVIISHRLETLRHCQRVLHFEGGTVISDHRGSIYAHA